MLKTEQIGKKPVESGGKPLTKNEEQSKVNCGMVAKTLINAGDSAVSGSTLLGNTLQRLIQTLSNEMKE